jgi:hypothetical protein
LAGGVFAGAVLAGAVFVVVALAVVVLAVALSALAGFDVLGRVVSVAIGGCYSVFTA